MKLAAVTVTSGGLKLAESLKDNLTEVDIFFPARRSAGEKGDENAAGRAKGLVSKERLDRLSAEIYSRNLKDLLGDLMRKYDGIICFMALGIVVRTASPWLKNKREDPAILAVDECGRYVISVLSGHAGGANELTRRVARILDAEPVITTATDVRGKLAFDVLAEKLGWAVHPRNNLKRASAALVNDTPIEIFYDREIYAREIEMLEERKNPPGRLRGEEVKLEKLDEDNGGEEKDSGRKGNFLVLISQRRHERVFKGHEEIFPCHDKKTDGGRGGGEAAKKTEGKLTDFLQLIPSRTVIGLGAKRGVQTEKVLKAIKSLLEDLHYRPESLKALATADIKAEEKGIIQAAERLGVPLKIFDREKIAEEIAENRKKYSRSKFVKEKTGVDSICEPTAVLAARGGELITPKRKFSEVTAAAARINCISSELDREM